MPGGCDLEDGIFTEHVLTSFDGLRIYFRRYGRSTRTQPPLLCLAGMSRNCRDYHDLATRLSQLRMVVCPDYRGVGRSQYARNRHCYTPQAWIGDVRSLLAALNLHKVIVVGTSFGGILAAAMAVAMPTVLAGAVLNDIGPDLESGALGLVASHIGRQRRFAHLDQAIAYMKSTFPGMPAKTDEQWRRITKNTFRQDGNGFVTDWDPAIGRTLIGLRRRGIDLWPLFSALSRLPILAFRGEKSDLLAAETFERMQRRLSGITAITVPDVGHAPDLARPDLAGKIEAFLETLK